MEVGPSSLVLVWLSPLWTTLVISSRHQTLSCLPCPLPSLIIRNKSFLNTEVSVRYCGKTNIKNNYLSSLVFPKCYVDVKMHFSLLTGKQKVEKINLWKSPQIFSKRSSIALGAMIPKNWKRSLWQEVGRVWPGSQETVRGRGLTWKSGSCCWGCGLTGKPESCCRGRRGQNRWGVDLEDGKLLQGGGMEGWLTWKSGSCCRSLRRLI